MFDEPFVLTVTAEGGSGKGGEKGGGKGVSVHVTGYYMLQGHDHDDDDDDEYDDDEEEEDEDDEDDDEEEDMHPSEFLFP